jgi:LacI family transcriptional regulator
MDVKLYIHNNRKITGYFTGGGPVLSITIKDIARIANVSTATVSRAINSPEKVGEEKKALIGRIMNELDFQPNALARGLIKKSTKTIGIFIPDINNMFYPAVVRGTEDTFEKNDYNVFLCNTDKDIEKEKKYINALLEKRVDGIIIMGTRPVDGKKNEHIRALCNKIPVLLVNDTIIGSNAYSVLTDEVEGAYRAVSYLIGLGHRKIAYVTGESDLYTTYRNKQKGYEAAMKDNGIEVRECYIVSGLPYPEGGYRGASRLLELDEAPTAIFAASDQIAMGAMKAAYEKGCRIPDDISIVGYANIPISADLYPELTTVDQFPYETGRLAAEVFTDILSGREPRQKKILLEPRLVIRKSCRQLEV